MKKLMVRLPDRFIADSAAESRRRKVSKSRVVRERLENTQHSPPQPADLKALAKLIGSVDGLPKNLSSRKKQYLQRTRYGRELNR